MPLPAAHLICDLIARHCDAIRETQSYDWFYASSNDLLIHDGDLALPLHTDDLWGLSLWVGDMTQEEFNTAMLEEIDYRMLQNAY